MMQSGLQYSAWGDLDLGFRTGWIKACDCSLAQIAEMMSSCFCPAMDTNCDAPADQKDQMQKLVEEAWRASCWCAGFRP